jgi:ribosomal protein S19
MVTKEIKQFIISQMKESNWEQRKSSDRVEYTSRYLTILHDATGIKFTIKNNNSYSDFSITRKELGFNFFHFIWLIRRVNKSCKLSDERKRINEISHNWDKFLKSNKDIKRDNKLNKILE